MDKPILITTPICLFCYITLSFIWTWPTKSDLIIYSLIVIFLFHLLIDSTRTCTKQHLWHNWHVGWFWHYLELYMTLTTEVRSFKFSIFVITFFIYWWILLILGQNNTHDLSECWMMLIWPVPVYDLDWLRSDFSFLC